MQPITVTVGPLANASANNIATAQTPQAGTVLLNGTPSGGTNTKSYQGTGSIAANVLTISGNTSGALSVGTSLSGQGVSANTTILAVGQSATTWIVNPPQTVSSTTIYGNQVVTLDKPREVLITTTADESAKTLTIYGTDWSGGLATESFAGANNTTIASSLSYASISAIIISGNASANLTIGTNGVASSPWVRFDGWAAASISIQADVVGTGNFTVQFSMDDPNLLIGAVAPANMTWVNTAVAALANATSTAQGSISFVPTFGRVLLNSGNGTVTTTFLQAESVTY